MSFSPPRIYPSQLNRKDSPVYQLQDIYSMIAIEPRPMGWHVNGTSVGDGGRL
ncbi:hypothetical protein M422DRAFT_33051 [Sphaerobolus stellatus SS14]|uniref:Unplaced genomic scaffold SPHSTscaffold_82, whole genome shotgun sequence n=1 Tax=Sphaerobolus stellatus (strain SS14) TaxID=990650 RepID=A0A0C9VLV9_SPHS4|nr:hypothetical protein M422DRAFT_33051 [Sphaerobolus stellatus SS14]